MEAAPTTLPLPLVKGDANNNEGGGGGAGGGGETVIVTMPDDEGLCGARTSLQPGAGGGDRKPLLDGSGRLSRNRFRSGGGGPAGRKLRRRVLLKSGEVNVCQTNISQRRLRYLQDIFTTLVDTQWRWTLLVFALSFILSWLGFALLWWLIAFTHGDLEPGRPGSDDWQPCVRNIFDFTSCFLFSIETQHTIGYGSRFTSEECPEAIFVMCLQSITGVMIQAFMVGIVFAKMSRPKQRTQTLLFSRNAVVCQRDGALCLMFRVGDMRKSHIIGAHVRAQLIRTRTTAEGEILAQSQCELEVGTDDGPADLFFIWPAMVVHRLTPASPLYRVSAADLLERDRGGDRFELVVILEGTIESTGQTTQARCSYLPSEILWGHRFEPVVSYNKDRQAYEVNFSKFNSTVMVDTPLCSAHELDEFYRAQRGARPPSGIIQRSFDSSPQLQALSPFAPFSPAHQLLDKELLYLDAVSYSSAHESDGSDVSLTYRQNGTALGYNKKLAVLRQKQDEQLLVQPGLKGQNATPSSQGVVEGARPSRGSPVWLALGSSFVDGQKKRSLVDDTNALENLFLALDADTKESKL